MPHSIKTFFDESTFTLSYIVFDENSKDAIIIDPVLNYDPKASKITLESIDDLLSIITELELNIHYILETHAHADHLSGAAELKKVLPGAKTAIGKNITKVQEVFSKVFNLKDFNSEGTQFDILLSEEEPLKAGTIEIKTIFTPGHTPACSSYLINDMLFTGDTLFMPDSGTGRCDFPAGSASDLYHSIHQKLYKLPNETRVFTGHDYRPNNRELEYESTIGENKKRNIQLKESTTEEEYIAFRKKRDAILAPPKLLLQSIQVNIDAGHLPEKEDNGTRYLRIPLIE